MRTQAEIEAAICEGMTRFEQEYKGRWPKDIHTHLICDLLVVRLQNLLTAAEKQLLKTLTPEEGRPVLEARRLPRRPIKGTSQHLGADMDPL
jgi:uncharacterized protein YbcI